MPPPLWKERRSGLLFAALVFGHLLLISIQVPLGGERSLFRTIAAGAVLPFQRLGAAAARAAGGAFGDLAELRRVRGESRRLRTDNFFLRQENLYLLDALRAFRTETELRANLDRFRDALVMARTVAYDAGNIYKSVTINRGTSDGVRSGMAVCDRFGNLIGRTVAPVTAREARVQLITDEDSGVSVVSAEDRLVGILSGRAAAGDCQLKYVLSTMRGGRDGEALLTTGYDRIYPAGLRVGAIASVRADDSLFKRIAVRPFFSLRDLDLVAVLTEDYSSWAP